MKRLSFTKRKILALIIICTGLAGGLYSTIYSHAETKPGSLTAPQSLQSEQDAAIENALYTRTEFFGADAIVPFPTAEARDRLAALLEKYPKDSAIFLKLSELDEKLNRYEDAEQELNAFVELNSADQASLERLARYFDRRARFETEGATLERILAKAAGEDRAMVFERLIELARMHKLEKYLKPEFYKGIIRQDASCFAVVEKYIDKLVEEKSYSEALAALRQYRQSFPGQNNFLEKEIEILLVTKRAQEAEAVYHAAFDPFWSADQSEKYYSFLSEQDRYRIYGKELKEKFKRNPADFDTALRLFHFQNYDHEASPEIFIRLEKTRAERKIAWQPEELLTVSRLLIAAGEGNSASRFLYTLSTQNQLQKGSELRAKVLYQLFEILSDAGEERIALTRGDLQFYRDVAAADSHPGITTGILSLIFSDTNPPAELAEKEGMANKLFNRAAAYRIFQIYKTENSTSPELAQMYLDIVRLYAVTNDTEIAAKALAEFEQRPEFTQNANTPDYPNIALKLADAYIVTKNFERERSVYQNILDYLGKKQTAAGHHLIYSSNNSSEPTQIKPSIDSYPPSSNPGISLAPKPQEHEWDDYNSSNSYTDFFEPSNNEISYSEVLNRFVASLARENRTPEILALYAGETKKYPNEAALDEQMLEWLGQTNLVDEQLKVYRQALDKFPNRTWQDRLARWFLKQERKQDFENFSRDLIEKLDDIETRSYLAEFIDSKATAKPESFDSQLYLALYKRAHERFPHNLSFVQGLLTFYRAHKQESDWRHLTAEYYFESSLVREQFLLEAAKNSELRDLQKQANEKISDANVTRPLTQAVLTEIPYKLFRADTAARLSNYEEAVSAYRELNSLYPNTPEYAERLITLTRSLGQINHTFLNEAAIVAHAQAESEPAQAEYRTRAGEIQAELGNYPLARAEWQKLIETGQGDPETYLETATVFWDYFQYEDAFTTIKKLREQTNDDSLYAFEAGAVLEAKHNLPAALAEYVKALDGSTPEALNVVSSDRAKRRLETLYARSGVAVQLQKAFATELKKRNGVVPTAVQSASRARSKSKREGILPSRQPAGVGRYNLKTNQLILGYADFLRRVDEWKTAANMLKAEIARNYSEDFLEEVSDLAGTAKDSELKSRAIRRLAATALGKRSAIKYRLQLAENLSDNKKTLETVAVLRQLVQKFPTNYGVLSEVDNFYWRINQRAESIRVLQTALTRAKGDYRVTFGRKLASRYLEQKNDPSAAQILQQLYDVNALDSGVYDELTKIYVRTGNRVAMSEMFEKTLKATKSQEIDFREITDEVAELRTRLIDALTRLKDYRAAVAQHIEIINRAPEDEENIEAAIDYVKRYGGADVLADYYQKTAAQAYKNYRWFVILARINEANNDLTSAAENYRVAISNQPEMVELYDALAAIYERQGNYNAAIENLSKTLELSNDDPVYLKRIIAVFLKAGRVGEAAAARQKLPVEQKPQLSTADQFAEAARLQNTEKAKAIEMSRSAFDKLVNNPFALEIKAADIMNYVQIVRQTESLNSIFKNLWNLRDKLILESEQANSTNAGKARAARQTLDGAIVEAIGNVARVNATGTERAALLADLKGRMSKAFDRTDDDSTLSLLQNLSRKAGFGTLEERILIGKRDAAFAAQNAAQFHSQLNYLLAFYRERGDYQSVLQLLEASREKDFDAAHFDYQQQIAENARLLGNHDKELAALREYFRQQIEKQCADCLATQNDALVTRYFEMLAESGDAGKNELRKLSETHSQFQLQLTNFLLVKGEKELAHAAIANSQFSSLWKQTRQAQTSFALNEYGEKDANYFLAALRLKPIGELIGEKPNAETELVGDDWIRAAQIYGQWLYQSQSNRDKSSEFLPAMIENRPQDAIAQSRLGNWYLEQKDSLHAIEHLRLALEIAPNDKSTIAKLGGACFLSGDRAKAQEYWASIIAGDNPSFDEFALYLETLQKYGQASEAREKFASITARRLSDFSAHNTKNLYGEDKEEFDVVKKEIRLLAASFGDYEKDGKLAAEEAEYFLRISKTVQKNTFLPEILISDALINRSEMLPFYELLIESTKNDSGSDYKFTELLKNTFETRSVEGLLDQQEDFKTKEPDGEKIKWQKERLDWLISAGQTKAAGNAVSAIEKEIEQRFARPGWLRLARLRLQIRTGNAAQTLPEFKEFVGVTVTPDAPKIALPSLERLNDSVNLLREENQNAEADELQQSFYARQIALEQFDAPAFTGLANLAFKQGNTNFGLKLLQIMTDLTNDELKETTAAELVQFDLIKTFAADPAKLEDVPATNTLFAAETLRIAAETAGKFGQFDACIVFRQKLRAVAPGNDLNRIELARLFAEKQSFAEGVKILAEVINDRSTERNSRWQAVFIAAEICANKDELWNQLKNLSPNLAAEDAEMWTAIGAFELNQTGRTGEALELLRAEKDNAYLQFVAALFTRHAGQNEAAITQFL
ncbi:MAG: hypothetical protein ABI954_00840, partial [Pyrinomonadaceae bacterium]